MKQPDLSGFLWLNAVGGAAVLASYALGMLWLGEDFAKAWGGVPESWKPWYVRSMLLAAAGYFPMTWFVLSKLRERQHGEAAASAVVHSALPLYTGILVGSALWMPLTCLMIQHPGTLLWLLIRADLAVVGLCSLALLVALVREPQGGGAPRIFAVAGAAAFCVQTTLLDAIVWPAYFSA